jgi:hypothetical protein
MQVLPKASYTVNILKGKRKAPDESTEQPSCKRATITTFGNGNNMEL